MRIFNCKSSLGTILLLIVFFKGYGQSFSQWHIQPLAIQTQWAKDVDPDCPLPEYPRPQMKRIFWENLNGLWDYVITDKDAKIPNVYKGKILVPYPIESALSGVKKALNPADVIWYKRKFKKPSIGPGDKVLLHFGAIDYRSSVYLNGVEVGHHVGGYTGFTFDITKMVSQDNELVVRVYDPTDEGIGPRGKQKLNPGSIYYTATSGIWQTVWLEVVPPTYITNIVLTPNVDNETLEIFIDASGDSMGVYTEVVASAEGRIVGTGVGGIGRPFTIKLKEKHLWSPDSPFLYDLKIRMKKQLQIIDEIESYFAFRKIEIKKDINGIDRIFLNNKYTYNLGCLDQGFWPEGIYTAPTDEALQFDIKAIKLMGFNTIRKHIKIEPERWYYHADRMGMLVWQDFVNPNPNLPEGSKTAFEEEMRETISQLYNHPCITTWVLFNEKWGQYDQQRLTEWVKNRDSTRLINGHSGELLYVNNELRSPSVDAFVSSDMTDVHSYPFPRNAPAQPGKARVLGEFGGLGVPIEGHLWDDLTVGWGYNKMSTPDIMQKQLAQMVDSLVILEKEGLSASIYTQPFDVESEQNGLLTYDRSIIKLPVSVIQSINANLWPITANYLSATKGFTADVAEGNGIDYRDKLREYKEGKNDSAFLRNLAFFADSHRDDSILLQTANDYVRLIKNPFDEANIRFIKKYTRTTKDLGFRILYNNPHKANKVLGENQAENLVMNLIYIEEIAPYISADTPDWDEIEKRVVTKYGRLGEERVWGNRLVYYATKKNWDMFGLYYKMYFDRAIPKGRSIVNINNVSWFVFEHITDVAILKTAIAATKYNLDKFEGKNPNSIDTYANLLYKIGMKSDAIFWERIAVQVSNKDEAFVKTLDKMEQGFPTWK